MKTISKFALTLLVAGVIFSCKKKEDDPAPVTPPVTPPTTQKTETLSGDLSTRTLDSAILYTLTGLVYVNDGVTLTIPEGTVLLGDKASKAALVVQRGGKLIANGTALHPVVFTSSAPATYRNSGDWGGVILCGRANVNQGTSNVVEGPTDFSTVTGKGIYGGTNDADNSGTLTFVRIEFAGISYAANKEINSLTLAGVGNGTTINHVQASYGGDDSFEWFGGTVNAKYLVAYKGWDDDFDTDFGYSGKVQFGYVVRGATLADQSGSNGFESDNDATGSALTPQTAAKFSNISILGPLVFSTSISGNFKVCGHIRRNSAQVVANSIMCGFNNTINFDKTSGTLKVKNNYFAGNTSQNPGLFTAGNGNDTTGFFAANYRVLTTDLFASVANESTAGLLKTGSAALTGADFTATTGITDSFFDQVNYIGAFGTTPSTAWEWTTGWLNFAPQTTTY